MKHSQILTQNIYLTFLQYVLPSIFGVLCYSAYILADTYFVANGVGETGLVALNIALPMFNLMYATGLLIGVGGGTLVSIQKGRNELEKIHHTFTQSIILAIIAGLIFTLCGLFFSEQICIFLGATTETLDYVNIYLKTFLLFAVAFTLNNSLLAFVRNDGNPRLAMFAMVASSFSNVVLDYLFVFPLNMGMFGAVIATCLSPIISSCILIIHFRSPQNSCLLTKTTLSFSAIKTMLGGGIPSFLTELSSGLVIFLFNLVILNLSGNLGVAAYGIIANISLVCTATFTGLGQGVQPIVSANYGAGQMNRVKKALFLGILTAVVMGAFYYLSGILFPASIAGLFVRDSSPDLIGLTVEGIRLYFTAFLFLGTNIVLCSILAAVQKTGLSFFLSLLRGILLILIFLFPLSSLLGMKGVWLTLPCAEFFTLLTGIILIRCSKNRLQ